MQHIPARGRKRRCQRRKRKHWGCSISPRGDGNFRALQQASGRCWDAAYPREGTETRDCRYQPVPLRDAAYPREGTETKSIGPRISSPTDAAYPREGTETVIVSLSSQQFPDAAYPREGTETWFECWNALVISDAAYPREGTETDRRNDKNNLPRCSISPQGDGNLSSLFVKKFLCDVAYPREGTEMAGYRAPRLCYFLMQYIPARGRKR